MDYRTKKAAQFFVACDANPDTRVKIPDAMRIKGYSLSEAANRSLQQQVRREADKIKGEAVPMQHGSVCRYIGSSQWPRRPRIMRSFGLTSSATFPAHFAGLAAKRRGCGRARSA